MKSIIDVIGTGGRRVRTPPIFLSALGKTELKLLNKFMTKKHKLTTVATTIATSRIDLWKNC